MRRVSISYGGGAIPAEKDLALSDFVLIHGNGQKIPQLILEQVEKVRDLKSYRPINSGSF